MNRLYGGDRRPLASFSSSSTLSPLAPPFTVDRPLPTVPSFPSLSSHPDPPPTNNPSSSHSFAAPFNWPSSSASAAAAGASKSPFFLTGGARPPPEEPYRHSYPSGFLGPDDPFEPTAYEGYAGLGAGPWNGPFDGEEIGRAKGFDGLSVSSWMEPSSSFSVQPPFQKGVGAGNLKTYDDDPCAIWPGKYVSSSAGKAHFGPESSTWLHNKLPVPGFYGENEASSCNIPGASVYSSGVKRTSYSQLSDSVIESSSTFIPDSSYDSFVRQLDSCLVNPVTYYPATTCSALGQAYMPSSSNGSSMLYSFPKHSSYLTADHVVPYLSDSGNMSAKPKEPSLDPPFCGGKDDHGDKSRTDYGLQNIACTTVASEISISSGNKTIVDNSLDFCTEGNPELIMKHLNIPRTCIAACGFGEPHAPTQNSLEALDHAVDSPCWKGASASQQSPFSVGEKGGLTPAEGLKGCSDLNQGQNHLPVSVGNAEDPRGQVGSLISHANKKTFIASQTNESLSVNSSTDVDKNSEDANKMGSDCLKDDNAKGVQCADSCRVPEDEIKGLKSGSEVKHNDATQFSLKEHFVAVDQFTAENGICNPEKGLDAAKEDGSSDCNPGGNAEPLGSLLLSELCSSPQKHIQLLVKTMHKFSEVLLSTELIDDNELEDQDCECVQLVIDNLEHFARRIKKAARSQNAGFKADVVNQRNMNNASDTMRKMRSLGSNTDRDEFDNFVFGGNADYGKFDGLTKALENVPEKTFLGQEENSQALLYKNLWIEAEVEMCKLKYEFQVLRMKLQMLNHGYQSKGNLHKWPDHETRSPSMFVLDTTDHRRWLKECSCGDIPPRVDDGDCSSSEAHKAHSTVSSSKHEADDLEASVVARFRVLKDRSDKLSSTVMEEHKPLDSIDARIHSVAKEAVSAPCSDSENNTVLERLPTKLSDLGFKECGPQPYSDKEPRYWSAVSTPDVQHLGASYKEGTGLAVDTSGSVAAGEIHMSTRDVSAVHSNIAKKLWRFPLAGGYDSPSSDWEHVQKEDFTM